MNAGPCVRPARVIALLEPLELLSHRNQLIAQRLNLVGIRALTGRNRDVFGGAPDLEQLVLQCVSLQLARGPGTFRRCVPQFLGALLARIAAVLPRPPTPRCELNLLAAVLAGRRRVGCLVHGRGSSYPPRGGFRGTIDAVGALVLLAVIL